MQQKKLFFSIFLVVFVISLFAFGNNQALANDWTISPDPMSLSTETTICIGFTAPGSGVPANYRAEYEFAAGFSLTNVNISDTGGASEVELYLDSLTCGGSPRIGEATETPDNNRDYWTKSGQKLKIDLEDALTSSQNISIKIVAKDGNAIVTPGSAGNYLLIVRMMDGSDVLAMVDADFMYVGSANKVNISANVDPVLTFTLSGSTCVLGAFSSSNIQTCNYNATIGTNGAGGYVAYIKDDGNLRNTTNDIDDTSGGTIAEGTEEYGVSTTKASQTITQINDADADENYDATDCTTMDAGTIDANASALTTSDQAFASASAPVASDVTTLCHAASITGTTPAGAYASISTITVVGTF